MGDKIHIMNRDRQLATKSLKRLYVVHFGTEGLSDSKKSFSRNELIETYSKNILFWTNNTPEVVPGMNGFTLAKHAICTNAVDNLWKAVQSYDITKEVDSIVASMSTKKNNPATF